MIARPSGGVVDLFSCNRVVCASSQGYLSLKIKEGATDTIGCPAHKCERVLTSTFLEKFMTKEDDLRFRNFDIKDFVVRLHGF